MGQRVITSVEGERFIHKELWRVVIRQLEHAKANPSGAFYDDLVAMTFAFHALEAYLNYVGEKLAPDMPAWMAGQAEALATSTFIPPSADFVQWHTIVKPWVEKAITGMLPHTTLGRAMASKLKVYAGPEHPHAAQNPAPLKESS